MKGRVPREELLFILSFFDRLVAMYATRFSSVAPLERESNVTRQVSTSFRRRLFLDK